MAGTTLKKLTKNKCYCVKKGKDINLKDCILFDCSRWKKCKGKTNADIEKDMKKHHRRDKNGKEL